MTQRSLRDTLLATLLALVASAAVQAQDLDCLDCHNPDVSPPIEHVLDGAHWDTAVSGTPGASEACSECHGESRRHRNLPTQIQPDITFGPKWTASIEAQNGACLACHTESTDDAWLDGKHATENLTCVTCHDIHQDDRVRTPAGQGQVCTVCHKVQKQGIHSFAGSGGEDPPCAECHDPHADPAPQTALLASRSEGCRSCHDLAAMAADPRGSESAKSYHKIMVSTERTCIDCHRGVIHGAGHQGPVAQPEAQPSASVTLFYPGPTSRDWLTTRHPGAQPLRQGAGTCRQCHQGDAPTMGQAPAGTDPSRDVRIETTQRQGHLEIAVSWSGTGLGSVSVMFDDGSDAEFAIGGCFAACHDDMARMSRQRDQGLTKYLRSSRRQERSIGRPALPHDADVLASMRADGAYVELWRATLDGGNAGQDDAAGATVETFAVLDARAPDPTSRVSAVATTANGRTVVTFARAIDDPIKPLVPGRTYTLGVAVHAPGQSGPDHWVSLPLTLSLDRDDTDLVVAP
jgi:predicted CXXCH cytochrome family protein